jgi:peptidoglycan/LPS O-acetylase OafA/YrhL
VAQGPWVLTDDPVAPGQPTEDAAEVAAEAITHPVKPGGASNKRTLDVLRGIAAMAVFIFHLGAPMALIGVQIPGYRAGEAGVQMFFVLSGYLIGASILAPRQLSRRDYVWKRVFRILPLYYFSILVVLLFVNATPLMSHSGVKDIIVHVLLIQIFFGKYRTAINPVLWTLSIEWLFYIFMLIAARGFRGPRSGWYIATGMLVLGLGWRMWIWVAYRGDASTLNNLYKQLPGLADIFACGMFLALILHDPEMRAWCSHKGRAAVGLAVSVVAAVLLLWQYDAQAPSNPQPNYWSSSWMVIGWPFAFALACAGIALCIQRFEDPLRPVLKWTGLAYLGLISYSLYLMHTIVLGTMFRGYNHSHPTFAPWLMIPYVIVMTIVLCSVTYYLVEQPFMRLRRQWTGSQGPTGPRRLLRVGRPGGPPPTAPDDGGE